MTDLGMPLHQLLERMAVGIPATIAALWLLVAIATLLLRRQR